MNDELLKRFVHELYEEKGIDEAQDKLLQYLISDVIAVSEFYSATYYLNRLEKTKTTAFVNSDMEMKKIVIITTHAKLEQAVKLESILEEDKMNSVTLLIVHDYMSFKMGVEYAGHIVSCNSLLVMCETDGSMSKNIKSLVDLASKTGRHINYIEWGVKHE